MNRSDIPWKSTLIFVCTSVLSFAVYVFTLVPEANWGDSAELSLQVYQLGVCHPPGYPIHTILGKALTLVFSDAAFAANLLSAMCTSLTVGMLSLILGCMTSHLFAAAIVPFVFAFNPIIWSQAVIAEVYNVNMLFLAIVLYLFLLWYKESSHKYLVLSALFYGISLGAHLANALLIPAFAFLVFKKAKPRSTNVLLFCCIVAVIGASVLSFSVMRSHAVFPIGTEFVPRTFTDTLRYFSGQQYKTMGIMDPKFYLTRIFEHSWIFTRNFLIIGIAFGFAGIVALWRSQRDYAFFLLLLVTINLGYFTFYNWSDYTSMVVPAYFVFSIFIAYGFKTVWIDKAIYRQAAIVVLVMICLLLFTMQLPERTERARSNEVTAYVLSTFKKTPLNAVLIISWNEFTPLLYFQKIEQLRPDCTIIARVEKRRYYDHGIVEDYKTYLDSQISSRPIVIDRVDREIKSRYKITTLDNNLFLIEAQKKKNKISR